MTGKKWKRAAGPLTAVLSAVFLSACGDNLETFLPMTKNIGGNTGKEEKEQESSPIKALEPVQMSGSSEKTEEVEKPEDGENSSGQAEQDEDGLISITISAAGDVTMGNYLGQDYSYSFREMYEKVADDSYFFENVYDIFSADDMTIVNLEGPLTTATEGREEQTYCISGDPAYAKILTAGSVEAVSFANNHRLDYYDKGTKDTIEALEEQGIVYAYDNNYAVYETKGIRIGYISVNEVGQGAGVEKFLKEGIEGFQEDGVDLILACCHWGIERENYPEDYQKSLGKKCIDWGADLVIGCHPHVLQGIEEYQGKYIIYSLGNFCFGANRNPKDKDCIIFQQTFTFQEGEKQQSEAKIIPCLVSSVSNINDYRPTPAAGEAASRIIGRMNEYSREFGVEFEEDGRIKKDFINTK